MFISLLGINIYNYRDREIYIYAPFLNRNPLTDGGLVAVTEKLSTCGICQLGCDLHEVEVVA